MAKKKRDCRHKPRECSSLKGLFAIEMLDLLLQFPKHMAIVTTTQESPKPKERRQQSIDPKRKGKGTTDASERIEVGF